MKPITPFRATLRFGAACVAVSILQAPSVARAQPFDGYLSLSAPPAAVRYLDAGNQALLNPTSALTIEFWVKQRVADNGGCTSYVGKGYTTAYWIGACGPTLRSYVRGSGSSKDGGTIPTGVWTHIAVTTDGAVRRHYINGVVAATFPEAGPPTASTVAFRIGSDPVWNFPVEADLDELRVWSVARTAAEIQGWMRAPLRVRLTGLAAVYPLDGNGNELFNGLHAAGVNTPVFGTANTTIQAFFVPVVLKNQFSSELVLTNRGATTANILVRYTATSGGGSGTTAFSLAAGAQRVIPDAIEFLRTSGLPIATSGTRLGTLHVTFSNLSATDVAAVTVRTGTDVASPAGRAGLAYSGVPVEKTLNETAWLPGLRFGAATDRTNVAIQSAGIPGDGPITLRLTLTDITTNPISERSLGDFVLNPGEFRQLSSAEMGLLENANAYVKVERVNGSTRFYAYAVYNNQVNSDGSFVPPVTAADFASGRRIVPSLVEAGAFQTELVLTNFAGGTRQGLVRVFTPSAPGGVISYGVGIGASSQAIFPAYLSTVRALPGVTLAEPAGVAVLTIDDQDATGTQGLFLAARTASVIPGSGAFGVFYPAVRAGKTASGIAHVNAVQQNDTNRSNLAFVNTGEIDDLPIRLRLEIWNGDNGVKVGTFDDVASLQSISVGGFVQLGALLQTYAPGISNAYVTVSRLSGNNPFIVYGVVNDGAAPGLRTGDGAYVAMAVPYQN